MPLLDVDDQVYGVVLGLGLSNKETPNQALRRHFGLGDLETSKLQAKAETRQQTGRERRRNTKLQELVGAGYLPANATVTFRDHSGQSHPQYTATIEGERLRYQGKLYTMSALAAIFLKKLNYASNFVRGPVHWLAPSNKTLKELWDEYLPGGPDVQDDEDDDQDS